MRSKACRVSEEYDFSSWGGARAVYFHDPEENVGELITRPEPGAELTLAEVGMPVEDVPAAVDVLASVGLTPYREGNESFVPIGDDEGLLIVVRVGRDWFPVGVPAGQQASGNRAHCDDARGCTSGRRPARTPGHPRSIRIAPETGDST